jgi:regulatory protein
LANAFGVTFLCHFGPLREKLMRMRRPAKRKETSTDVPASLGPDEIRRRIFQRAVKLLAAKPRSVAELRDRLLEGRRATEEVVETVVSRLREYGYLDDEHFALSFASLKVKQKPVGRRRLEQELKMKKVDPAVADEALEAVFAETSEEDLIDQAIEKRLRIRGRPKNRADAKSLFDHLLRLGFPFELVSEKVRAVAKQDLTDD